MPPRKTEQEYDGQERRTVHMDVCNLKHGELNRALAHIEANNNEAHLRIEKTSIEACARIELQLQQAAALQEEFMKEMRASILGNGTPGLKQRVAALEDAIARSASWFVILLKPALPVVYGLILAAIVLYFKQG